MNVLIADTIRELVRQINENQITKDQIVFITKDRNQYFLLYYN